MVIILNIIENSVSNEIVIKNSRFICYLYNVESEDDVKKYLNDISIKHKDSTHVTYAYRLLNKQKYFDDGEPGGTAGAPIMEVILKNDLVNVLAVVVRYFGGIKLGAGGLIRAYSKAVKEALILTNIKLYEIYNLYEIKANYENLKLLNNMTSKYKIKSKDFSDDIVYVIEVKNEDDDVLETFKNTSLNVKKTIKI